MQLQQVMRSPRPTIINAPRVLFHLDRISTDKLLPRTCLKTLSSFLEHRRIEAAIPGVATGTQLASRLEFISPETIDSIVSRLDTGATPAFA